MDSRRAPVRAPITERNISIPTGTYKVKPDIHPPIIKAKTLPEIRKMILDFAE